ncbi:hypothetical protein L6452_23363 [Arctium lappa]|uniref:Uncharacterized protein n=1 Tax=Arctium lappa TaxID=4217 RepID=A0ACB9B114_ARCLA|nr:hypothetical protein L6452_23363 [Arctium lappa]
MVGVCENAKAKDGGGTIRIGATGKVSALMMQELDSNIIKTSSKKPEIGSRRIQTAPVSVSCGGSTKRLQRMVSMNGGGSSNARDQVRPEKKEKKKMKKEAARQAVQRIPMLDSEDLWIDKTPIRAKEHGKKAARRIVETVDLKCGKHEGDWSIIPIGNQLRRLSFSKISN